MKRWMLILVLLSFTLILISPRRAYASGVVGTGTPASCTESALDAALAGGGMVTFNCGPSPVTITITSAKTISSATSIDGGTRGLITISGNNRVRIFWNTATLNINNLALVNGRGDAGGAITN